MQVLGLDIGGANIKAATADGAARSFHFALWQNPSGLTDFLTNEVLSQFPSPDHVALTMTGELCDCYQDKPDGVRRILDSVEHAGIQPNVYSVSGSFLAADKAREFPLEVAASNWHALANLTRRYLGESTEAGILIDIGSTSCDLIPISQHEVHSIGSTDLTRILNQELVYTGVKRTPVCAVANQIDLRGTVIPVAEEMFATMQDVYLVVGDMAEEPENCHTADGRPFTLANSLRRLARMLCADPCELVEDELVGMAKSFRAAQLSLIEQALAAQLSRLGNSKILLIHSGSGSFLLSHLSDSIPHYDTLDLSQVLGDSLCESAPAYAVAVLLAESLGASSGSVPNQDS